MLSLNNPVLSNYSSQKLTYKVILLSASIEIFNHIILYFILYVYNKTIRISIYANKKKTHTQAHNIYMYIYK